VDVRRYVRDIPDFPRSGIVFKDITPLLLDPSASAAALEWPSNGRLDTGSTSSSGSRRGR
jgi:adenine phosphoribosyltransferase